MRARLLLTVSILLALSTACSRDEPAAPAAAPAAAGDTTAATPPADAAPVAQERIFRPEELDQMLAPVALYPDSLLAQVLMASTYPGDVAEAVTWSKANPDAKGDSAIVSVQGQPWDPSVQSLVAFPQVVAMLGQDPPWVQRLGDAFLAQPEDVMDSVQRLRHKAQDAGTLASNEYLAVSSEPAPPPAAGDPGYVEGAEAYSAGSDTTIIIEPATETVYVPAYDPTTAYGTWAYPSYPPVYYPPAYGWYPGQALWTGLAFGAGIAIADGLWGDCDWDGGDVDIDVDRYNNINVNDIDRTSNRWEHNANNRDGTPYRDQRSREQFSNRLEGSDRRSEFRGDDPARAQARDQARQSMEGRGLESARTSGEARDRARDASAQQPSLADRGGARDGVAGGDRAGDRAGGGNFSGVGGTQDRQRAAADYERQRAQGGGLQPSTSNRQSRDTARTSQPQRSSAFSGASRPQQSRQQYDRGRSSYDASQRHSGGSRSSAGRQTTRSAPSRSSGGRSGGSRGGGRRG